MIVRIAEEFPKGIPAKELVLPYAGIHPSSTQIN
jgi:hypothetical protein